MKFALMTKSFFLVMIVGLTPVTAFHAGTFVSIARKGSMHHQRLQFYGLGHYTFLKAAGDDDKGLSDGVKLTSGRKVIGYDTEASRFFETDAECTPDVAEDEYCAIDEKTGNKIRLTVQEKERIFLDALQSYYFSGRQLLNDADFDLLKEDLSWNGSPVVSMNRKEATYLAAVEAYLKGKPIMANADFDALKAELKEEKSLFAVSTEPKCFLDSGICTVTLQEDFFRNNLLYLPALSLTTILWLGFGFEILEPIIRVNPLFLLLLGFPITWTSTKWLTEKIIFPNYKIAYGPCPACGAENRVFFGDILGVEGFSDVATSKCSSCKVEFNIQRNTLRASTLPK